MGEGKFTLPTTPFNTDGAGTPYAMKTWGAIFLEVGIEPDFADPAPARGRQLFGRGV
jgi:xanthine dehydrogenase YagR molybdenum-binding subunit